MAASSNARKLQPLTYLVSRYRHQLDAKQAERDAHNVVQNPWLAKVPVSSDDPKRDDPGDQVKLGDLFEEWQLEKHVGLLLLHAPSEQLDNVNHITRQRKEADERNVGWDKVLLDQVERDELEDLRGREGARKEVNSATL